MSFTTTITFPAELINDADTYQLIMVFTHNATGTNTNVSAEDQSLLIKDHGELSWEYDIEDTLMVPGNIKLHISDISGYLKNIFFGTTPTYTVIDKRANITIKINGITEFSGQIEEDSISYDEAQKSVFFEASSNTKAINSTELFKDDVPLDPLDYSIGDSFPITDATYGSGTGKVVVEIDTSGGGTDPVQDDYIKITGVTGMTEINSCFWVEQATGAMGVKYLLINCPTEQIYISGGTVQVINLDYYLPLTTILEDIFSLGGESISYSGGTLSVQHNWEFDAGLSPVTITNAVHAAGIVTVTHNLATGFTVGANVIIYDVVGMTDLNGEHVVLTHIDNNNFTVSLTTAQTYTSGGFARRQRKGDITDVKMYLRTLFYDPSYGLTNCGDIIKKLALDWFCFAGLLNNGTAFFRKLRYYDNTNTQTLGQVSNRQLQYYYPLVDYVSMTTIMDTSRIYERGTYTTLEDRRLVREEILPGFFKDLVNGEGGSNIVLDVGTDEYVWYARDDDIDSSYNGWYGNGYLLAELWYGFRASFNGSRVDIFEDIDGIDYNFFKNFIYSGSKYQIVSLTKKFSSNTSTIKALYLGEE